ncbi:MAG: class I SAM-dependent methyltransferase [Armatimonadetes bacterium]|nr:class I SAM-dependent methyltransferase [Armatimonadota bacterium]
MPRTPKADEDQFARIAPHYDALMENVPYDMWADYVSRLALRSGRPIYPGSRLLDLATGTGSMALQFAERGCVVTGIDISAPMIEEARRKAAARKLEAEFKCADIADFETTETFDHAICLYDSLNYLLDSERLEQTFACIGRTLGPAGVLIFDVNTIHALEQELFTQTSRPGAAVRYNWKSRYDPRTRISRIKMNFRVVATNERLSVVQHQRGYTEAELRSFLYKAGFSDIVSYDAYRTSPPGPGSDRVFYVCSRP